MRKTFIKNCKLHVNDTDSQYLKLLFPLLELNHIYGIRVSSFQVVDILLENIINITYTRFFSSTEMIDQEI